MNVEMIMTREVKACRPDDTLATAAQIMWENDCGCVPVVNDEKVLGMITDRDICISAWTQDTRLSELHVAHACSGEAYTCSPQDPIAAAEATMRAHQVRRLPVVDEGGRLVGVLSLNDIARSAAGPERKGAAPQAVTAAEVGAALAAIGEPGRHAAERRTR
jgi:CBS domain-containing protein